MIIHHLLRINLTDAEQSDDIVPKRMIDGT